MLGVRKTYATCGIAMIRFFKWIKHNLSKLFIKGYYKASQDLFKKYKALNKKELADNIIRVANRIEPAGRAQHYMMYQVLRTKSKRHLIRTLLILMRGSTMMSERGL